MSAAPGTSTTVDAAAHRPPADTFDLVVVGGGLAGWTAAVRAQAAGAHVALVERSAHPVGWGNSLVSGGVLHAVQRDPRSPPEGLLGTIIDLTDGRTDPDVARAWAEHAAPAVAWIESHGAYLVTDPEHALRARVFAPVRPTVPGLLSDGFGTGNYLAHLSRVFAEGGGTLHQPARAVGLTRTAEGWRVSLVSTEAPGESPDPAAGGPPDALTASAVALCDGGFQADPALLRRYVGTDAVKLRAAATATGDGLRMGLEAGGVPFDMRGFYGHILSLGALERDDLWPYPILDLLASVGVLVGPDGRRFVDEGYDGVNTANHIAWSEHPLETWLVVDDAGWEAEGRVGVTPPNPHLLEHGAPLFAGATVAELARSAGIDETGLAASVDAPTSPPRTGRVCLEASPFRAIPVVAGVTFTLGGLRVDGSARVLSVDGTPIPGLYAAGGTMGGLHGGPRVGYAGGLLEAAVFGLIAGTDAARSEAARSEAARGDGA